LSEGRADSSTANTGQQAKPRYQLPKAQTPQSQHHGQTITHDGHRRATLLVTTVMSYSAPTGSSKAWELHDLGRTERLSSSLIDHDYP
jgi:hypothetical protein